MGKDYLVEGAKLMCINGGEMKLLQVPVGHGYTSNFKKKANCGDCKACDNIPYFGTCNKNEKTHTCEGYMLLADKWENISPSLNFPEMINGKEAITMDSVLICKKGGLIIPVTSGQGYDAKIDWTSFMQRFAKLSLWTAGKKQKCHVIGGDPINLNTGNFVYEKEELLTVGITRLSFRFFYNAMEEGLQGCLGEGWHHNYEFYIQEEKSNRLINVCLNDGRIIPYKRNIDDKYDSLYGDRGTLQKEEEGLCYLSDEIKYVFNQKGMLIKKADKNANTDFFYYNSEGQLIKVKGANGGELFYKYNKEGKLIDVKDHTGRNVQLWYRYGKLFKFVNSLGNTFLYYYNENGRVESVVDPDSTIRVWNQYDGANRVVKQKMADEGIIEIAYDDKNMCTYLKEQNGNMVIYESDDKYRNIRTVYEVGEERFEYNDKNQKTLYVDKNGNKTKYRYDSKGNLIEIENALEKKLRMTYIENNRKITSGSVDNGYYKYIFDEKGNIKKKDTPEGYAAFIKRNSKGQTEVITQQDGSSIVIEHDSKGNISQVTDAMGNTNKYQYDELNRVISITDGNGNITKYEYKLNNNIVNIINPLGKKRTFEYDQNDRIISVIDYDGYNVQFNYEPSGKKAAYKNKQGDTIFYEYDKMGNLIRIKYPNGAVNQYVYNRMNQLIGFEDALGYITRYEYDKNGNRVKVIDKNGEEVLFFYDALNRLTKIIEEDGAETVFQYNDANQIVKVTYPGGYSEEAEYNKNGNKISKKDVLGNIVYCQYNAIGLPVEIRDDSIDSLRRAVYTYYPGGLLKKAEYSDGKSESYLYDGNRNIKEIKRHDGYTIFYTYDSLNRIVKIESNIGECKRYKYNDLTQIIEVVDVYENVIKFKYSPEGNMVLNEDAFGNKYVCEYDCMDRVISVSEEVTGLGEWQQVSKYVEGENKSKTIFDRDLLGRVTCITDILGNKELYEYDNIGKLIKKTDRDGFDTHYSYDLSGNRKNTKYADGRIVNYKYNELRQLVEIEDWLGCTDINPDCFGRIESIIDYAGRKISYEYGKRGERKKLIYSDGTKAEYQYDELGRLSAINDGSNTIYYMYDQYSRLIKKQLPNGVETTYEYGANGLLAELMHKQDNSVLDSYKYKYDLLGNKMAITKERRGMPEESGLYNYEYDKMGKLLTVSKNKNLLREYNYDSFGNRIGMKEDNKNIAYQYNIMNQLVKKIVVSDTSSDHYSYVYDKRGNIAEMVQNNEIVCQYFFDSSNRLEKAINKDGVIAKYTYNGFGNRIKKEVKYSDSNKVEFDYLLDLTKNCFNLLEMQEGNQKQRYVWDNNVVAMDEKNKNSYYVQDELGSPLRLLGMAGKEYAKYKYDEFGKSEYCTKQPFGYTGYIQDNVTGTYYAQAREYAAEDGRFTGEDPICYKSNWYVYCSSNPFRYIDPTGLLGCHCEEDVAPDWLESIMGCQRYGLGFLGITTRLFTAFTKSGKIDGFLDKFLGFKRGEDGDFHIRQDSWQNKLGYNNLYDFGFDAGTDMSRKVYEFTTVEGEAYRLWMWKGDYINLGAGAETGIYNNPKYDDMHWEAAVEEALPMTLTVTYEGEKIVDYKPGKNEPKWWVTGFDPMVQGVCASDLQVTGTIDFSGEDKEQMWKGFKNKYDEDKYSDIFSFNEESKTVTYNW